MLWVAVAVWLLCLLGARTGIASLGMPWHVQMHLRRRLRHADAAEDVDLDGFALGAKGIGESGAIGSTPAIWNAVVDAVSYLGVENIDMPALPERVWQAIQDAKAGAPA